MLPYEKAMSERKVIVKVEDATDSKWGKKPEDRTVEELLDLGIINVNKPKGPTSHETSDYVKQILGIKKAGQSGTLDPAVTGVLPVGLGRGTRVLRTLLKAGKEYVCLMHVHGDFSEDKLKEVIMGFVGINKQMPPVKSAVVRKLRDRKVYYIKIIEIDGRDILFRVGCQAGTYIRVLCHQIGEKLGCGAHMAQLLRTKVGQFNDDNMFSLQEITDACVYYKEKKDIEKIKELVLPIETAVEHIPKIWVFDSAVEPICHGSFLAVPGISKLDSDVADSLVAVMTLKNELIGLGTAVMSAKKIMNSEKGIAVKMESVIMKPGTYKRVIS